MHLSARASPGGADADRRIDDAAAWPATAGLPDVCGTIAGAAERAEGIPEGLVRAVALARSGRWLPAARRSQAWPWTVTSSKDTSFWRPRPRPCARWSSCVPRVARTSTSAACRSTSAITADAFGSLDEALEPATNIAYGAGFLKRLRDETRSWARATARYHSSDPGRGEAYRAKVLSPLAELRHDRIARAPIRLVGTTPRSDPDPPRWRRSACDLTGRRAPPSRPRPARSRSCDGQ